MAQRFIEIDYDPTEGITVRLRPSSLRFIPEPTMEHLRTANKELLLALRSFVDEAIQRMETKGEPPHRPRRVRVQSEGATQAESEEKS